MGDNTTSLYVWGFDLEVEGPEIFDFFYGHGGRSLESVSVYRDERRNSLRRARAEFRNPQDAHVAMILRHVKLNRDPIYMSTDSFPYWVIPEEVVERTTQGRTSRSQVNSIFMRDITTSLYVWGFDPEIEGPEIFELFYGDGGRRRSLESISIYRDQRRNSLRRAIAKFRNPQHAHDAMINLSGYKLKRDPIYMSLYSFPYWVTPEKVVEMTTQGKTLQSQVLSFTSFVRR